MDWASTGFRGGSHRSYRWISLWSGLASCIDALTIFGLALLSMMALLLGFRFFDPSLVIRASDPIFWQSLIAVFLSLSWIYMVTLRMIFAQSLGEWTCGLRLGRPRQFQKSSYPLRVMYRAFLVVATGFIAFPLLSWLSQKDLAGRMCGLEICQLRTRS